MRAGWAASAQGALLANELPGLFKSFPSSVTIVPGVTRLSHPATVVADLESVTQEMSNRDVMVAEE